jgi:peptidoglycan hydrolase-like protein with peptidoglycan-binding domain
MIISRRFRSNRQLQQAELNSPPLTVGAQGDGVAELQDALCDLDFDLTRTFAKGRADGIYGSETEKAVRKFQEKYGLAIDGVAGRDTIDTLDEIIAADPRLDAPSPATTAASDAADRVLPLYRRTKANW